MSEHTQNLEELEALRQRLEGDIRRSTNLDPGGLSRNSPLLRNYEKVQQDIMTAMSNAPAPNV
jgi:hypothetical protein